MHRHAEGLDVRPQATLVLEDRLHVRGLRDHRERVVRTVMLREMPRAMLVGLLRHESREVHLHGQVREFIAHLMQRPQHRRHRSLRVTGTPAPDAALPNLAAERIDRHSSHSHRVQMRAEDDARLCLAIAQTAWKRSVQSHWAAPAALPPAPPPPHNAAGTLPRTPRNPPRPSAPRPGHHPD